MKKFICLLLILSLINVSAVAAPSSWAEDSIAKAKEMITLPDGFEDDWQKSITRKEFAELAIRFMAHNLDYELEDFFEYAQSVDVKVSMGLGNTPDDHYFVRIKKGEPVIFDDCDDRFVLLAADMGIVEGRGASNVFAPDDFITREEAAVMLARITSLCSATVRYSTVLFDDYDSVSAWAKDGVRHMKSSGVMTGVGNNLFDPKGLYTREQAIVTFVRQSEMSFWQTGKGEYKFRMTMERAIAEIEDNPIMAVREKTLTEYGTIVLVSYGGAMHAGGYGLYLVTNDGEQINLYSDAPAYNNLGYKPLYDTIELSEDGKTLTYTFTFEDKLEQMNAVGTQIVTYHEKGTYVFTANLETGEVTYVINKGE